MDGDTILTIDCLLCLQPPESLKNNEYSRKSDVYSYGVVVFEVTTRMDPWPGVLAVNAAHKVLNGEKMQIPQTVPQVFVELMHACWATSPTLRPEFSEICDVLEAHIAERKREIPVGPINKSSSTGSTETVASTTSASSAASSESAQNNYLLSPGLAKKKSQSEDPQDAQKESKKHTKRKHKHHHRRKKGEGKSGEVLYATNEMPVPEDSPSRPGTSSSQYGALGSEDLKVEDFSSGQEKEEPKEEREGTQEPKERKQKEHRKHKEHRRQREQGDDDDEDK